MPLVPGSSKWLERMKKIEEIEDALPKRWFCLSFVDPDKPSGKRFLGVCFVQAGGPATAMREAHGKNCNPGGEMKPYAIPEWANVPEASANRLMSKDEADAVYDEIDKQAPADV